MTSAGPACTARDPAMHQLLLAWAQWLRVGDGSGYPTMSVLHEDWTPPAPGIRPAMKSSRPSAARHTHRIVCQWSATLRATVFVHYCFPALTVAEQAQRVGCAPRTVHDRIAVAHRLLARALQQPREATNRSFSELHTLG